ncbi:MAG: PolC-type DNA polymerase III, partial [Erysipelotrichaceae bacterium]
VAEPRIIREELKKAHDNGNLLFGSSCANGVLFELAQTRSKAALKEAMRFYDYIEIQPLESYRYLLDRGSIDSQERLVLILKSIIEVAQELGKIVVATGDAHYVHPEQKMIRDIYIQSQAIGGVRHPLYIYNQERRRATKSIDAHLRTTEEMLKQYPYLSKEQTYQIVVENTNKIAEQIEVVYPVKDKLYPPEIEGCADKLRDICYANAKAMYGEVLPDIVEKRLEKELNSIIGNGFQVVYYISHLLVKKSLDDGYLVGSRGSVGSSFVATMSNITEVNPLAPHYVCPSCQYSEFYTNGEVASGFDLPTIPCPKCGADLKGDGQDIPFETFLGFEGDKVPDIDLNFSGEYQEVAHNYTKEVFGERYVYRAGTIGTVAQQTAFGYVKGYQEEMGLTKPIGSAQMLRLTQGCEGVKRTTGQHPGGIIVIPDYMDVHDFTPVQFPANNPNAEWKTTHFEFHDIHDNVLKLDILGHVDPTAMKLLEKMSGIDPKTIPLNDPQVMSIFSDTIALKLKNETSEKTGAAGIPEFGTAFVRGILDMTRPTTFDELVRISGLSHGTDVWLNNAKDLIEAGICTLKEVIGCRDDIMVYLMHKGLKPKTAFDIMEFVRKGKGLKDEWIPIMKEHNVEDWYIDSCRKIKYMFPKAHAVAYVLMAVRIAWFKVHYPQYYYAVYFSIRCDAYDIDAMIQGESAIRARMSEIKRKMDNPETKNEVSKKEKDTYSCLELALEMHMRGLYFTNIDLMRSQSKTFIVDPERPNYLIPPFTSIDGLGESVGDSVIEARNATDEHGNIKAFLSKEDLLQRTSLNGTHLKRFEQMGVVSHLQDENQLSLF